MGCLNSSDNHHQYQAQQPKKPKRTPRLVDENSPAPPFTATRLDFMVGVDPLQVLQVQLLIGDSAQRRTTEIVTHRLRSPL